MRKHTGRFDMEDVGWEQPEQEDPLSRILIRASQEVQYGAIIGFAVGVLAGLIVLGIVLLISSKFWVIAPLFLFVGLIGGAITGKIVEIRRTLRKQARRAKKEKREDRAKKKRQD